MLCKRLAEFRHPQMTELIGQNTAQAATVREMGTQTKPGEAGLFGNGGAREQGDARPSGRDERSGLCPDDVRCSGLHPLAGKGCRLFRQPFPKGGAFWGTGTHAGPGCAGIAYFVRE